MTSLSPRRAALCGAVLLLSASLSARADFQGSTHLMPFDEDTLRYSRTPDSSPVAQLQKRLDDGTTTLRHDAQFGYLPAILDELKIPRSSQMLVGSKTSFQRERISPRTPRALYFNDTAYIGYINGSPMLELSTVDPKLGGVFYTLEQRRADRPRFVRTDQCTECHASAKTMGVPGHLIRSFAVDERGAVDLTDGTSLVNHRTPLAERWGGWFVTGRHGKQAHRGNLFGREAFARAVKEPNWRGNVTRLDDWIETANFPRPTSDIVALLVLEHQSHMHNFITRLNYESTLALSAYGHLNYLNTVTEAFVKYLLFSEEAPLTAPVRGTSGFAEEFAAIGPKDRAGRSLRDFDLRTRLFKHPCSYLIHSEAFDALPARMKEKIYARLWDVLRGKDNSEAYEHLKPATRRAIVEIIADTKKDLPDYWKR